MIVIRDSRISYNARRNRPRLRGTLISRPVSPRGVLKPESRGAFPPLGARCSAFVFCGTESGTTPGRRDRSLRPRPPPRPAPFPAPPLEFVQLHQHPRARPRPRRGILARQSFERAKSRAETRRKRFLNRPRRSDWYSSPVAGSGAPRGLVRRRAQREDVGAIQPDESARGIPGESIAIADGPGPGPGPALGPGESAAPLAPPRTAETPPPA